jgi:hypothetical protein
MWVGVLLMLACMVIYLITDDLRWPIHGDPQPMVPIAG